jgi:membrane associated rhomboid family serine protease
MRSAWEDPPESRGVPFAAPSMTRVTKALLIVNVVLFVLHTVLLDGWFPRTHAFLSSAFALNPLQWQAGFPLVPLWQLVSYGFLHGGPGHLLSNMLFLFFLGSMLEAEIGARRFLVFYLLAIALAGACQLGLGLALGQAAPIVGASGGVLAVVFAMATLRPNLRILFLFVPLTLRTVALIHLAIDLLGVIGQLKGQGSNVASFAHLTGAAFGFLAVRKSWIWRDPLAAAEGWRERRTEARAASDEEELDALLAKINREGIHALSARERAFLKRVSQRKQG